MVKLLVSVFLFNVALISAENAATASSAFVSIADAFKNNELIPDVLPVAPKELLKVKFPSGAAVSNGNEITPTQAKDQPEIDWTAEDDAFYTVMLLNPDVPDRNKPTLRSFQHWLVGNIPGKAVDKGDVLSAYIGSAPPKDTGLHRYLFLLYKQPGKIEFTEERFDNTDAKKRIRFSPAKFAGQYSLGDPIAGDFFQAQFDDYVPVIHKQIGIATEEYLKLREKPQ